MSVPQYLIKQLRDARIKAGLTQRKVGEYFDASDGRSICDLERGRGAISLKRLQDLCDLYQAEITFRPQTPDCVVSVRIARMCMYDNSDRGPRK